MSKRQHESDANSVGLSRAALLAAVGGLGLMLSGCGGGGEDEQAAADDGPSQLQQPQETAGEDSATTPTMEPVVIDQAAGTEVESLDQFPTEDETSEQAEAAMGESMDDGSAGGSPLAGLPGIPAGAGDDAGEVVSDAIDRASITVDSPVLVQATVIELMPRDENSLMPLEQFLGASAAALSADEAQALDDLVTAMAGQGLVRRVGSPRLIVPAGDPARIELAPLGTGDSLALSITTNPVPPTGETDPVQVRLAYDLAFTRAESRLQVLASGLGLDVGPRASVGGVATVEDRHTLFMVRGVRGTSLDRDLLILIRPQAMAADLTK